MNAYLLAVRQQYIDSAPEFSRLFNTTLKNFWCNYSGFDVAKFDEFLQPPDGVSSRDHTIARFGQEAADFIQTRLLVAPKPLK